MTIFQKKPLTAEEQEAAAVKDFFDMLLPGAIRFYPEDVYKRQAQPQPLWPR